MLRLGGGGDSGCDPRSAGNRGRKGAVLGADDCCWGSVWGIVHDWLGLYKIKLVIGVGY